MSRSLGDVFQILSGNVGLGTTQPRQLLDVQGGHAIISGNVGIGTTNPLVTLAIGSGATDVTSTLMFNSGDTASNTDKLYWTYIKNGSRIGHNAGWNVNHYAGQSNTAAAPSNGNFHFFTGGPTYNERLTILNNGNIGIGSTQPAYRLDVAGNAYFNGSITTNNNNINAGTGTVTATTFSGTATKVSQNLIRGTYLTGANYNGSVATTWAVDADTVATASKIVARDASANIFANGVGIGTTSTTNANISLSGDVYYNVSPLPVLTQSTTVDGYPIILHAQSTTGAGSLASNAIAFASMTSALSAQTPGAVIQFRRTGTSGFGALELCTKSAESLLSPVLPRIVMEGGNVGIGTTDVTAGKLVVAGNIVPTACNVYSLGTTNLRWKDIYLAGKTIDLDGAQITKDDVTGGILLQNTNGGRGDIKAANIYTSGNVGIGTTIANSYTLDVEGDINFTGTLYKNGSIFSSGGGGANIASTEIQIAPIRKIFYVQDASQNTFTLIKSGFYGGHASNVQVFVGQNLLSYYNSNINDYYLSIGYNSSNTIYQITLTENVDYASIVDITVWPSILPNSIFQGYANQYITTLWNSSGGVNVYYNIGNVGIGTITPLQKLHVEGTSYLNGTVTTNNNNINAGAGTVTASTFSGTATKVSNDLVIGSYLTGTNYNGAGTTTWAVDATTAATANKVVARDASGYAFASGVGIGTATARKLLDIQGGDAIVSGNIGIGTTNPQYKLDVLGGLQLGQQQDGQVLLNFNTDRPWSFLQSGVGANTDLHLKSSTNGKYFLIKDSTNNTFAGFYSDNSVGLSKLFAQQATIGEPYRFTNPPANTLIVSGNVGIGTTAPRKLLDIQGGDAIVSGNVGIGTTVPTHKLHIYSASRTDNDYESTGILLDNATQGEAAIAFRNSNVGVAGNVWVMGLNSNSTRFDIGYGAQTSQLADALVDMCINTDGNVGIGTTNPLSKLHVSGYPILGGTSTDNNNSRFLSILDSAITTSTKYITFGKANSINNQAELGYTHISDGSATNYTSIGLYGSAGLYVNGSANVGIGTTNPLEKFHLRGKAYIDNTSTNAPANGVLGSTGTRIILWPGTASTVPYSIGITSSTLWYATQFIHAWYVGTTERMRLDANGNVGIGTATVRQKLDIQGGDAIVSGNIGIGTTNIAYKLDVYGTGRIHENSFLGDSWTVNQHQVQGRMFINATTNNPVPVFSIGQQGGSGDIAAFYNGQSPVMIVNKTGSIGIGTTNPTHKIHIYSLSSNDNDYESTGILLDNATQGETAIAFRNFNVGVTGNVWVMGLNYNSTRFDIGYGSQTSQLADASVNMSIQEDGNIGIGTTSPVKKLDVNGDINFNGNLYQNNALYVSSQWTSNNAANTLYYNGNVGIGTATANYTLNVIGDINYTGALYKNGTVIDSGNNEVQITPIRKVFYVQETFQNTFILTKTGFYGGNTSNVQVFVGQNLLSYYSPTINDYNLSISYNDSNTIYQVTLTDNVEYGRIVDITIWPTIISGSNIFGGIYQNVNVITTNQWKYGNGNNIYYYIGNVGIGTTIPLQKLHVDGSSYFNGAITTNNNNINVGTATITADTFAGTATRVSNNLYPGAYLVNTFSYNGEATVTFDVDATSTATANKVVARDASGYLFASGVGIGTTAAREILDIQGGNAIISGNVGIGTTIPLKKLDVQGDINFSGSLYQNNALYVSSQWTSNNATNTVYYNGNVGIGTTNPQYKLDVAGTVRADRYISTIATGTAPLAVSSTTLVTNLNTDLLDGQHGSYYLDYNNLSNKPVSVVNTFNTRSGDVTLTSSDVTTALTYTPLSSSTTGTVTLGTNKTLFSGSLTIPAGTPTSSYIATGFDISLSSSASANAPTAYSYSRGLTIGITCQTGALQEAFAQDNVVNANNAGIIDTAIGNRTVINVGGTAVINNGVGSFNTIAPYSSTQQPLMTGLRNFISAGGTGGIATAKGILTEMYVDQGSYGTLYGIHTVTNMAGNRVTTAYGIYNDFNSLSTNNSTWGLYLTGEKKNYMAGNVGIGEANPVGALHIKQKNNGTTLNPGNNGALRFVQADTTDRWDLGIVNGSTDKNFAFYYNGTAKGYFASAGANTQQNFTGQHRCFVKNISYSNLLSFEGRIVSSDTNEYISMSPNTTIGQNAITISESLPIVRLTTKHSDKAVFGVISTIEDPDKREDTFGNFVTPFEKEKGDTRAYINSVGEGAIWVSDKNGPLEAGDYITSCELLGYGTRQTDDLLHNYTVAKITMDCDFQPPLVPKLKIKKVDGVNILDEFGNLIWEPEVDEEGEIIMEHKYKLRYLSADGSEITKEIYESTSNSASVYRAAFVGCTYHCG